MAYSREDRTVSSALWAAYGDILGFPTELVDRAGVQRRIGLPISDYPRSWKRMIGGRQGTWVELDAGTYSDDTQLRLATSRAIRQDGYFDVEAFAKIELPVWLSYCLGAGRGSKVAAGALSQRSANWFSNFFEQRDVIYTNGGGNGAAMRIQPHVWASSNLENPATYLPEVIQNSICTHGHPRGIAGAVIHAVCLAHVMQHFEIPPPDEWGVLGSFISIATQYIEENPDLSVFWLPTWNARTNTQFAEEMECARIEWEQDVATCLAVLGENRDNAYEVLVQTLGGLTQEQRGSGLKSALFSLAAAWLYRNSPVNEALTSVVNLLDSDTDTIGTMTGALLGALYPQSMPNGPIKDHDYIIEDAQRLYKISQEESVKSFSYPDMLTWQPPRSQVDVVSASEGTFFIAGLGRAKAISEEYIVPRADASWQWFKLDFGQTILCKRRRVLSPQRSEGMNNGYQSDNRRADNSVKQRSDSALTQNDMFLGGGKAALKPLNLKQREVVPLQRQRDFEGKNQNGATLDEITDHIIRSGFDPKEIGMHLLRYADLKNGAELAVAFTAIIVKAKAARLKKNG